MVKVYYRKHRSEYDMQLRYFILTDEKRFYHVLNVFLFSRVFNVLTFLFFSQCEADRRSITLQLQLQQQWQSGSIWPGSAAAAAD